MKIQNDTYTHHAATILPSGATLEILKCETGYLLRGKRGDYETEIALTHEAINFVIGVASGKIGMDDLPNVNVDLPDTAAQDSASKSNNPAVSG